MNYMNMRLVLLLYVLLIYFISDSIIEGEKVSKYQEINPEGNFGNDIKRKLEEENYIIVKYDAVTKYSQFKNDYRNGIIYIINENKIFKSNDSLTIQANN